MRIGIGDFTPRDYTPESPYQVPLGGAQSAAAYLAAELVARGHELFYLCHTSKPGNYRGVNCIALRDLTNDALPQLRLDALVVLLSTGAEAALRKVLGAGTKLILWTGHAADQPGVAGLRSDQTRSAYDRIVLVSDWQRQQFIEQFNVDAARVTVIRNAAAACFIDLFPQNESILAAKHAPPILAYTSTPFRGLHLIPEIFPLIRNQLPGTTLRIFSSMEVYDLPKVDDHAAYGSLYATLRSVPGIEYIGSVPQPELARHMREVQALIYPNTFAETSCIAVMDALAAGCRVVTSRLGALPETAGGFAQLISPSLDRQSYVKEFAAQAVQVLAKCQTSPDAEEQFLRSQVNSLQDSCTWKLRAQEWERMLKSL